MSGVKGLHASCSVELMSRENTVTLHTRSYNHNTVSLLYSTCYIPAEVHTSCQVQHRGSLPIALLCCMSAECCALCTDLPFETSNTRTYEKCLLLSMIPLHVMLLSGNEQPASESCLRSAAATSNQSPCLLDHCTNICSP